MIMILYHQIHKRINQIQKIINHKTHQLIQIIIRIENYQKKLCNQKDYLKEP